MKEKETKLAKGSSRKIQASPGRTMWIIIKKKQGALKINCQDDHQKITSYNLEPDKWYCTDDGELEGVSCAKCRRFFAEKEGSDMVVPRIFFFDLCMFRETEIQL